MDRDTGRKCDRNVRLQRHSFGAGLLLKAFSSVAIVMLLLAVSSASAQTTEQAGTAQPAPATQQTQQTTSSPSSTSSPTVGDSRPAATPQKAPEQPGKAAEQPASTSTTEQQQGTTQVPATFDEVHVNPMKPEEDKAAAASTRPATPSAIATGVGAVPSDSALRNSMKTMRVDVNLVLVPVTITDPMNRLVTGLERDNFVVMDNGEKQSIRHFSSEDAPVSLGVIFDMSGSMSEKMERAKEAVIEFFKTANPDDEFFLVAFNDKPEMISDFTNSIENVQSQLVYAIPKGRTALMDAVYVGLAKMRQARNQKKALLIISDGGDNHSRYTENEIKSLVKEADVQIYAIGIFSSSPGTQEEVAGPMTLAAITDVTGGRTFTIDNPNELADVATKIGIELRNQYVIGYRPTKPARDGKWRKIKVKLMPPKGLPPLTVYSKTGYYAPTD